MNDFMSASLPELSKFKVFLTAFVLALLGGAMCYDILSALLPEGRVFGALPRMFLYHKEHPYDYIILVALVFASVLCLTVSKFRHLPLFNRIFISIGIMIASVLIASGPGGMLWKIHDMQAGYFPQHPKLLSDLMGGFWNGLQIGWLIMLLSFPYNLLCLIGGCFVIETTLWFSNRMNRNPSYEFQH
jgi:hypothetical protein